ncbi:MAG: hypothetical protein ABH857_05605 [Elusimicrobiota bacterium]
MRPSRYYWFLLSAITFFIFYAHTNCLAADNIVGKIQYQGRLKQAGVPVTGKKSMVFNIYNALTGGALLWSSGVRQIDVLDGIFEYTLGKDVLFSETLFSVTPVYLQIIIDNTIQLSPRMELLITPYAIKARKVDWTGIQGVPIGIQSILAGDGTLAQDSIGSYQIIDATITAVDIADYAITTTKIDTAAVTTEKLADLSVTEFKISTDAVTGQKIKDGTILDVDISTLAAIGIDKISSTVMAEGEGISLLANDLGYITLADTVVYVSTGVIGAQQLKDGAVTNVKILSMTWTKLTDVPAGFADGIDNIGGTLSEDSIGSYEIIPDTLTTVEIKDGSILDADISTITAISVTKISNVVMVEGENVSLLNNDAGYLTGYVEIDPKVGIVPVSNVPKWNGAVLSTGTIYDVSGNIGIGTSMPSGSFQIKGSFNTTIITVTNDYTVTNNDYVIAADGATNSVRIYLPTAVGVPGRMYEIIATNVTNSVIIDPYNNETINGELTYTFIGQYESITIISDGSNWFIK